MIDANRYTLIIIFSDISPNPNRTTHNNTTHHRNHPRRAPSDHKQRDFNPTTTTSTPHARTPTSNHSIMLKHTICAAAQSHSSCAHHGTGGAHGAPLPPTPPPRKPRSQSQSSAETSTKYASTQHHRQSDATVTVPTAATTTRTSASSGGGHHAEARRWFHNQSDGEDTQLLSVSAASGGRSRRRNRSKGDESTREAGDTGTKAKSPSAAGDEPDEAVAGGGSVGGGGASGGAALKISRRRPPSGTENAVRRWNSFHSTRGECHPNKFRRDRKSTSPSIDVSGHHRRLLCGALNAVAAAETAAAAAAAAEKPTAEKRVQQLMDQHEKSKTKLGRLTQRAKLLRGRSLATSDTVLGSGAGNGSGGGGATGMPAGVQYRRHSQQQRAASLWYYMLCVGFFSMFLSVAFACACCFVLFRFCLCRNFSTHPHIASEVFILTENENIYCSPSVVRPAPPPTPRISMSMYRSFSLFLFLFLHSSETECSYRNARAPKRTCTYPVADKHPVVLYTLTHTYTHTHTNQKLPNKHNPNAQLPHIFSVMA